MKHLKRGFTLIELLVVISIIGLLASVALASLNVARVNAANAVIKENLAGIRAQGELYINDFDDYGTAFYEDDPFLGEVPTDCSLAGSGTLFVQSGIQTAIEAVRDMNPDYEPICKSTDTEWMVMANLKQVGEIGMLVAWCVDSRGNSMETRGLIQGGVTHCIY